MSEFAIPASLLAELPADPADLLAVAMRLAQFSFKEQSTQAEAEVSQLRTILLSRQTELRSTGRRCDELEAELAHARAETRRALAEVERLNAEKTTLVESVKSLSKEVVKLDHFKVRRTERGVERVFDMP